MIGGTGMSLVCGQNLSMRRMVEYLRTSLIESYAINADRPSNNSNTCSHAILKLVFTDRNIKQ